MNIALIAHDAKKKLMQNFCIAYRAILSKNELYATGTTGRLIEEVTNLNVHKYLAGHLGGEQQLGSEIEHNDIDMVIFLRDPQTPKSHEPDINNIFNLSFAICLEDFLPNNASMYSPPYFCETSLLISVIKKVFDLILLVLIFP